MIPDYGAAFLADVYDPAILEILYCVSRKNAKSALVAVLLLAHLADDGPLRRRGWRAGVVSISKLKAGELKLQAQQIAEASGLRGLHFRRSPAPGRIESAWGAVDVLSSESDAGAAHGFSVAIVDELGLLSEAGSGARQRYAFVGQCEAREVRCAHRPRRWSVRS